MKLVVKTGRTRKMLSPETKNIQLKLGEYCRTGELPEIPGIHSGHVKHYRRLIFNVVSNNIKQAFPIAKRVIAKETFRDMIQEFFSLHDAETSQIWKLPGEFYSFADSINWSKKYKMPWLNDLLLFEWTELKVHTMPDRKVNKYKMLGDLYREELVLNPDHELINLNYPVHLLPVKECVENKSDYYILIFRELDSGKVRFINLSKYFAFVIRTIRDNKSNLQELLEDAYNHFNISDKSRYPEATANFLLDLQKQGFLLGFSQYPKGLRT